MANTVLFEDVCGYLAANYGFDVPMPVDEVLDDVDALMWNWTERGADPMQFGLFRANIDDASVAADEWMARRDPNLATWKYAPGANAIEQHTLAVIGRCFGAALANANMHFTSGGQESNHTAVVAALCDRFPDFAEQGMRALASQPVLYISQEGHHSFEKIACCTGLGRAAIRRVACDDNLKMASKTLRDQIAIDLSDGLTPFMIVGTAGTTGAGSIDPLQELAEIANEHDLWLHVDAAYGGAVVLSQRLRPMLSGIERADSITCDAHKMLGVPVGAGMFFCRHRAAVQRAFAVDAPYLSGDVRDAFQSSMQWSRRFIGLKLFMLLAVRGLEEITRRIEHQAEMAELLRERLRHSNWKIVNETQLPIVCFWHDALDREPLEADRLVARLLAGEEAWLTTTKLCGRSVLRACITNSETQPEHIERLVRLLKEIPCS